MIHDNDDAQLFDCIGCAKKKQGKYRQCNLLLSIVCACLLALKLVVR